VYEASERGVADALKQGRDADVLIKASGVGVFDELLERAVLDLRRPGSLVGFCDVDAPATLARLDGDASDPFASLIPEYDFVFTYGGGAPVTSRYLARGARICRPIYNGVDVRTHRPAPSDARFEGTLGFMGNRLPDREARVEEFFFAAARRSAGAFVLAGSGWQDKAMPSNVRYIGHLSTRDHNAFNCSARAVLNICRDSMASSGFSPATRVFEAAAAGACLITDDWLGVEQFFEPGSELLVAQSGAEVAELLAALSPADARAIGERARRRARAEHGYEQRAAQLEELLRDATRKRPVNELAGTSHAPASEVSA
jgi:spore maturation protein CgeB